MIATNDLARDGEVVVLQARLSTASAQIKTLRAEIKRKDERIEKLTRMTFGQKSEKCPEAAPEDSDEEECARAGTRPSDEQCDTSSAPLTAPPSLAKKPRGLRGRQKLTNPQHLRREVIVLEPELGQFCSCGCRPALVEEQVVEKLAYRPAEVYVVEERFPKYCCRKCNRFVQAKVPDRVFDYSRFDDTMSLAAVISKFADFLPHHRLQQIFGRSGLKVNRSTLWRLARRAGEVLKPLYEALISDLQASGKLFMDETTAPLQVLGLGKTKTAYMWSMCRDDRRWKGNQPPAVAFKFALSREGIHGEKFLGGFAGILQVDGYAGYNRLTALDRIGGPINLTYCWAHVRRKFFDAWSATKSEEALKVVHTIDRLFEIERALKVQPPVVRQTERARLSEPIVAALFQELEALGAHILMKSALGDAINYTMKLREGLKVFLTDGRVEMDNNPVENVIRPLALIRKNSLFAGSEVGGEIWAILSSLVGTCKLNSVEPFAYLSWVFDRIAKKLPLADYHKLLPWHYPTDRYLIEKLT